MSRIRATRRANEGVARPARLPWLLSDWGITTTVVVIAALGTAALLWMLHLAHEVPKNYSGAGNRYALKIESVKYGLGAIAAGGAAAALLLAIRRQRLAERTQHHTEDDAQHRRFTELYTKAVEQLGHNEAAVRLGGLYALERVAQDNADQRQTIVSVLCAYLRMPFDPDVRPVTPMNVNEPKVVDARLERQVRLTAQHILATHLRDGDHSFWPDIYLNLEDALLINFEFSYCIVRGADFTKARFDGPTIFTGSEFADGVSFEKADFTNLTSFGDAKFKGITRFVEATFAVPPVLYGASEIREGTEFQLKNWPISLDSWPPGWEPDRSRTRKFVSTSERISEHSKFTEVTPLGRATGLPQQRRSAQTVEVPAAAGEGDGVEDG
jgi:hypothetical protein